MAAIGCAADANDLMTEIAALRRQNAELVARLERQQRQIDDLARRISEPAPAAPQAPVAAVAPEPVVIPAPVAKDAPRGVSLGKLHLNAEGAVALFSGQSQTEFSKAVMRVDETKLFLEGPITKNTYFFSEVEVFNRDSGSASLRSGELYVDFESVSQLWGRESQLSLRLGRVDIPFGEEYGQRDAFDNPLISHTVADFWGVDEGAEIYGSLGRLQYVVAVQNGGHPAAADGTSSKAMTARFSFDPLPRLHLALSGMRTGSIAFASDVRAELWFGNTWITRQAGSTATAFQADLWQLDARQSWASGHLAVNGGALRYSENKTGPNQIRRNYFGAVEVVQKTSEKTHLGLRYSLVDSAKGFLLPGDGAIAVTTPTENLWRLSFGAGYQLNPNLRFKAEYSFNGGRWLGGAARKDQNQLAFEAAFKL